MMALILKQVLLSSYLSLVEASYEDHLDFLLLFLISRIHQCLQMIPMLNLSSSDLRKILDSKVGY